MSHWNVFARGNILLSGEKYKREHITSAMPLFHIQGIGSTILWVVDSKRVFTTLSLSEASPSASASVQNPSLTLPLTLTSTPKVGYYPIPVGISSILGAAQSTCRALAERLTQYVDHTSTHITCSLPCSRIQTWYMINLGAKPGGNLSLQCNWLPPDLPDAFFMIFQQRSSIRE